MAGGNSKFEIQSPAKYKSIEKKDINRSTTKSMS
jgi:hypothetical protein